jgi:hypothetical protein
MSRRHPAPSAEVVRRAFSASATGDIATFLHLLDPGARWLPEFIAFAFGSKRLAGAPELINLIQYRGCRIKAHSIQSESEFTGAPAHDDLILIYGSVSWDCDLAPEHPFVWEWGWKAGAVEALRLAPYIDTRMLSEES